MQDPTLSENDVCQSVMLVRASKWLPFGGLLFGLVFCTSGAIAVEAWWPIIAYLVPWSIHAITHYVNQNRFLREAVWGLKVKVTGQVIVLVYSSSLAVWAILVEWYAIWYSFLAFSIYVALLYRYFQIYLARTYSAWEERRRSNYRFAIDPDTLTFRFYEGFNFGTIPGMRWDNLIFGTLLGLTTFSGALIGDLAGDLGVGQPIVLAVNILSSLAWTRGLIAREVVTLQKIREYEKEHGVTIRPR